MWCLSQSHILSAGRELGPKARLLYFPPMKTNATAHGYKQTGWHLPGEFEPQVALMLAWPHADTDWAPCLPAIRDEFQNLILACLPHQHVILLKSPTDPDRLPDELLAQSNLHVVNVSFDDTWCRDFGPISLINEHHRQLLDFTFTAWDKGYENTKDNLVTSRLCQHPELSDWIGPFTHTPIDFVLEGGAIESNGQSAVFINWYCLEKRHPALTREAISMALCDHLQVQQVMGIDIEPHEGDDTDGHIDTLARFISPDTIVVQDVRDPKTQQVLLEQIHEIKMIKQDGSVATPTVIRLPAPHHEWALPLNYVNFTLINGACLAPVYGLETDAKALEILAKAMPKRRIVPIRSNTLISQFGGPHCATMHFPATSMTERRLG